MPGFLENLMKPTEAKYTELTEHDYFAQFYLSYYDIVMSMFEWEDLPDTVDQTFMEKALFENGIMAFHKDEDTGKIYSLRASPSGVTDMYGYAESYTLTSAGASIYNKQVKLDDLVLCYNNKIRLSTSMILGNTCSRLANISATIDTNVNAIKTPIIIEASPENINSIKTMYDQFKRNAHAIFTRKNKNSLLSEENFKVHNTGAEFYADRLLALQHDIENDLLTRIGINNTNIQKKERLVSNEVDSNLMEIMSHAYSMLDERVKFCEKVNDKYGTTMSVKFRAKKEIDDIINSNINVNYDFEEEGDDLE